MATQLFKLVIDANTIGQGLVDALLEEQVDPSTGETLGCWATINTEQESEDPNAPEYIYALKSQGINHDIIINFINMIEGGKVQLLEKRIDNSEEYVKKEVRPFASTDGLLDELANLKIKDLDGGKFSVIQQTKAVDKDKYSALAYGLYYIDRYEDNYTKEQEGDMSDYLLIN